MTGWDTKNKNLRGKTTECNIVTAQQWSYLQNKINAIQYSKGLILILKNFPFIPEVPDNKVSILMQYAFIIF
jgi:hypothetical protein